MSMSDDEGYGVFYDEDDDEGYGISYEEEEEEEESQHQEPIQKDIPSYLTRYGRKLETKRNIGMYDPDEDYFGEDYTTVSEPMDPEYDFRDDPDYDYEEDPNNDDRLSELEQLIRDADYDYQRTRDMLFKIKDEYITLYRAYKREQRKGELSDDEIQDIYEEDLDKMHDNYFGTVELVDKKYNTYTDYLDEYENLGGNMYNLTKLAAPKDLKEDIPKDLSKFINAYNIKRRWKSVPKGSYVEGGQSSSDPYLLEKKSFSHKKSSMERYLDELIKESKRLKEGLAKLDYFLKTEPLSKRKDIEKQKKELNNRIKKNKKEYLHALSELNKRKEKKEEYKGLAIIPRIKFNNRVYDGTIMHPSKRDKLEKVYYEYINTFLINNLKSSLGANYKKYIKDPENFDFYVVDQQKGRKDLLFPMTIKYDFESTLSELDMDTGIYSFIFDYDKDYEQLHNFLEKLPRILKEHSQKRTMKDVMYKDLNLIIQAEVGEVFLNRREDLFVKRDVSINDVIQRYFFDYFDTFRLPSDVPFGMVILNENKDPVRKNIDPNDSFLDNALYDDKYIIIIRYDERKYENKIKEIERSTEIDRKMEKKVLITDDTDIEPEAIIYNVQNSTVVMDVINKYFEEKPINYPVRLVKVFEGSTDNEKQLVIVKDFDRDFFDNKLNAGEYYIKLFYFIDYEQTLHLSVSDKDKERQEFYDYSVNLDTNLEDVLKDYIYNKLNYPQDIGVEYFNFEVRDKVGNIITVNNPSLSMSDNQLFFREYHITIFPNYFEIENIIDIDKAFESVNIGQMENISEINEEPELGFDDENEDYEFSESVMF